ncbi:MAG: tryptophanase [Bacteroidetes bacterium]|nr:tryptophanase [Bacteroidota bacterium]
MYFENQKTLAEPFRIKMVEPLKVTNEAYRLSKLRQAGYNPFLLNSEDVFIDLLTDSGTGAMSDRQWAGLMMGDESYAGARSWHHLEDEVKDLTGMPYVLPTHQGRAAERILYGLLGGKDKVFISNTHFDTTRANIEFTGATAIDIPCAESTDTETWAAFKGNMDIEKLESLINEYGSEQVGAVILTVTNNSAGGQPVSMANAKAVRDVCSQYGVLLVLDGCRIAENSYYIRHREAGFGEKTYREIASGMFAIADAFIMSAKKDGLVNMGGLLTLRSKDLAERCTNLLIISEGFATYGGLTGRDMEALAIGLREVFNPDYLEYRIKSTEYLGNHLREAGIPLLWPTGGHAIYIDAQKMYPHIPVHEYPGQALVCSLYQTGAIRSVEVGSVMFGKTTDDGMLIPAAKELVRLAIPRRVYTQSHIDYVVEVFTRLKETAAATRGYRIVWEPPFLRHFTARFEPV